MEVADGCKGYSSYKALEYTSIEGTIKDEIYPYKAIDTHSCMLHQKLPFKNKGV